MNYIEALEYLSGFVNFERQPPGKAARKVFDLERIKMLAARLGHPERRFESLHIAGTKGKGSTAAFCEEIARAAGLATGTYCSPHLVDLRERIRLDGRLVSKSLFARTLTSCLADYEAVRAAPGDRRLTYFEALTHLAFQVFAENEMDLAIIEVGMGGRLDATNIIRPLVSVITAISMDHSAQLGSSLSSIAGEKGGICKRGIPVVIGRQRPAALRAIRKEARLARAGRTLLLGKEFCLELGPRRPGSYRTMTLRTPRRTYRNLKVRLLGAHQLENAAVAVTAMEIAAERGTFRLSEKAVRDGLEKTRWPGRFEVVRRRPVPLVLDGAHNVDSMQKLVAALDEEFPNRAPLAVVFACAADKDIEGMLKVIAPRTQFFVATGSGNPRAVPPRELARLARKCGAGRAVAVKDMNKALAQATAAAGQDGLVAVTGSLYLVGRAKGTLKG
jgi:dihydrofolate synthase / folylpolyglutamate synthase